MDACDDPCMSIIWLHGLGADAHDFVPIVPHLKQTQTHKPRFVFPQAPVQPVTVNGGMPMRAWYDILGVDIDRNQDQAGIERSVSALLDLVQHERARSPEHPVLLAGFSQGGAVALRTGLASSVPIAGVMGLSTYLLGAKDIDQWCDPDRLTTPVFLAHGEQDPIVPIHLAIESRDVLMSCGFKVRWHTWPMGHEVCGPEITVIDQFLSEACQRVSLHSS